MVDVLNFDFQFSTTHVATGRPCSKAHFLTCTTKNIRENCHSDLGLTWYLWVKKAKESHKYTVIQRELGNLSTTVSVIKHCYIMMTIANK